VGLAVALTLATGAAGKGWLEAWEAKDKLVTVQGQLAAANRNLAQAQANTEKLKAEIAAQNREIETLALRGQALSDSERSRVLSFLLQSRQRLKALPTSPASPATPAE